MKTADGLKKEFENVFGRTAFITIDDYTVKQFLTVDVSVNELWQWIEDALKEHDNEFIKIIKDMKLKRIKEIKPYVLDDYIDALNELEDKIK